MSCWRFLVRLIIFGWWIFWLMCFGLGGVFVFLMLMMILIVSCCGLRLILVCCFCGWFGCWMSWWSYVVCFNVCVWIMVWSLLVLCCGNGFSSMVLSCCIFSWVSLFRMFILNVLIEFFVLKFWIDMFLLVCMRFVV